MDNIHSMNVDLYLNINDRPIWTPMQSGSFTLTLSWEIQRQKNDMRLFDSNTWCKKKIEKMYKRYLLGGSIRKRIFIGPLGTRCVTHMMKEVCFQNKS